MENIPLITKVAKMGPHHVIYIPKIRQEDFAPGAKVKVGVIINE